MKRDKESEMLQLTELLAEFVRSLTWMGAETSMNMPAFMTALSPLGNELVSLVDASSSIISTAALEVVLGNPRAANEQWRGRRERRGKGV